MSELSSEKPSTVSKIENRLLSGAEILANPALVRPEMAVRLHLGCGQNHFNGYINLDYPPSEHTVIRRLGADAFVDIRQLDFPASTIDEVRLHHVFEHFERPVALALLIRWHTWLKTGGRLVIETPDFEASARRALDAAEDYDDQLGTIRHLFGSHEAAWAVHYDGWFEARFRNTLEALDFGELEFEHIHSAIVDNIIVRAVKTGLREREALRQAAMRMLRSSMVDRSASEERLWQVWVVKLDEMLGLPPQKGIRPDPGWQAPRLKGPKSPSLLRRVIRKVIHWRRGPHS